MTAFTERDRAKRAKQFARYKQKSVSKNVSATSPVRGVNSSASNLDPPVETVDNRDDDEQLTSVAISASDSAPRDTAIAEDYPKPSSCRVAMAKKKLAASRKATSPMKTTVNKSNPIMQTKGDTDEEVKNPGNTSLVSARRAQLERQVVKEPEPEPVTPPRNVSKRAEMARRLAASRAAAAVAEPTTKKLGNEVLKGSALNTYAGSRANDATLVKAKYSSNSSTEPMNRIRANKPSDAPLVKPEPSMSSRTKSMERFNANKTGANRFNELARLRASSPALSAALAKPVVTQPKTNLPVEVENYDSDHDASTGLDDESTGFNGADLARTAVLERREQYRRMKEGFLTDISPEQFNHSFSNHLVHHPEQRRNEQEELPVSSRDHSGQSFANNVVSMSGGDSVSDPPLPNMCLSSSRESDASNPPLNDKFNQAIQPPPPPPLPAKDCVKEAGHPPKNESMKVNQEFKEGIGFSQEDFSNASWGLGPAFSNEIVANGEADWSCPVNCSSEQKGSSDWADFDAPAKRPHEAEENVTDEDEDKENVTTVAVSQQEDLHVEPSATESVHYVDFGVGRSRGGSVDCNSVIDEEEEQLDKSIMSEETTASATEFDPLSMFGGSGEESKEMKPNDDDNARSSVSWATPKDVTQQKGTAAVSVDQTQTVSSSSQQEVTVKAEDETNSISFPSLNSGSLMKPPKPAQQVPNHSTKAPPPPPPVKNATKPIPDSPSGTESLESWWQSRYASSQNNDINAAVQEALLNETSSVSKKSQADSSKNISGVSTLSSNLTPVRDTEQVQACVIEEESCSIFSGIEEESVSLQSHKDTSGYAAALAQNILGPKHNSIDSNETEDIFSGMSVSNTKDHQAVGVVMKSAVDGMSTGFTINRANAESQSMMLGNGTRHVPMTSLVDGMSTTTFSSPILQTANAASQSMFMQNERTIPESREALSVDVSENNYGVIELKNNERSSPANSYTSDITSSVIFSGRDPPRRFAHNRSESYHQKILESNESQETGSRHSGDNRKEPSKMEQVAEVEVDQMNTANRGVSLMARSTSDSSSDHSSLQLSKRPEVNSGLSGLRDQAKAAILSRFSGSCAVLNASSFAMCSNIPDSLSSYSGQAKCSREMSSSEGDTPSDSYDDESYHGSRHSKEESENENHAPQPPLTPHSIKLRECSNVTGAGGVEVLPSEVVGGETELPVYKSTSEAQKEAHEALLLYAYTALAVPPPITFVEKGEGAETDPIIYPSIDGGVKEMGIMMERFQKEGISVLKLNRQNQWQSRILTVTKDVNVFLETNDARFKGIDSCPKGLLWMKKFNDSERSASSIIGKKAKGGLFFSTIESISVTKGKHSLSKKQQKGEFKDSFTLVLHANDNGTRKDINFRVAKKDDLILLSSGLQAVIDRMKNEEQLKQKSCKLTVDTKRSGVDTARPSGPGSPVLSPTKPFAMKAVANPISDDRWEV